MRPHWLQTCTLKPSDEVISRSLPQEGFHRAHRWRTCRRSESNARPFGLEFELEAVLREEDAYIRAAADGKAGGLNPSGFT